MRKEDIERLREEVDIVELVGEVVSLEKRGNNHVGLCPFHGEKTPSFNVSSARRRFHCFGCGINGDIFTWVQERELLSFPEAVRYLAERAGVAVEVGAKGSGKARVSAIDPRIETLRRVCKEAQDDLRLGADDASRACRLRVPPPARLEPAHHRDHGHRLCAL